MADEPMQPEQIATEPASPEPQAANWPLNDATDQDVQSVKFRQLSADASGAKGGSPLELILDVQLGATVELGRSRLAVRDILALGPGSLVELDKLAGEPADLLINGKPLARGEIVVIDENFGIRITEIMTPTERMKSIQ